MGTKTHTPKADKPLTHDEIATIINTAFAASHLLTSALGVCEEAKQITQRLIYPRHRRSTIHIEKSIEKVAELLRNCTNWSSLQDISDEDQASKSLVFQGKLPSKIQAFGAHTKVCDLYRLFGPNGIKFISIEKGRQNPTEFFAKVPFKVPTDTITVKVTKEDDSFIFREWWPGIYGFTNDKISPLALENAIIHCDLPPLNH